MQRVVDAYDSFLWFAPYDSSPFLFFFRFLLNAICINRVFPLCLFTFAGKLWRNVRTASGQIRQWAEQRCVRSVLWPLEQHFIEQPASSLSRKVSNIFSCLLQKLPSKHWPKTRRLPVRAEGDRGAQRRSDHLTHRYFSLYLLLACKYTLLNW